MHPGYILRQGKINITDDRSQNQLKDADNGPALVDIVRQEVRSWLTLSLPLWSTSVEPSKTSQNSVRIFRALSDIPTNLWPVFHSTFYHGNILEKIYSPW